MDRERIRLTREKAARRAAERQGLRLEKSRQRDPRGRVFNTWQILDDGGGLVAGDERTGYGLSIDDVEAYLGRGKLDGERS